MSTAEKTANNEHKNATTKVVIIACSSVNAVPDVNCISVSPSLEENNANTFAYVPANEVCSPIVYEPRVMSKLYKYQTYNREYEMLK